MQAIPNKNKNYLAKELNDLVKQDSSIFNFIQDASTDGMWYWDLENPENEWMNDRFWQTLGYNPDEMPHKSSAWQDIIFQEDLPSVFENFEKHKANPKFPYDQVVRYRHKKGHTVYIRCRGLIIRDDNGNPKRMLGTHSDVTELKQKSIFLEKCNATAIIGFWSYDLLTHEVYWSNELKRIYGVAKDFKPSHPEATKIFKEDDVNTLESAIENATRNGITYDLKLIMIDANGQEKWVRATGIPEMFQNECIRLYGTLQDIDELVKAEQKLSEQTERLKNFAYIVSHNLRSFSGNIKSLTQFLEEDVKALEGVETFSMLKEVSNNLFETVNELSQVIELDAPSSSTMVIPLALTLDKIIESQAQQAKEKGVSIHNEVDKSMRVNAIPSYLNSILLNLTTNAIKYAREDTNSWLKISAYESENEVVINFMDNGKGMDIGTIGNKLFGLYETFHNNQDARGIGLYLTKQQIAAMHGQIEVQSELNQGTTFTIKLPNARKEELLLN